MITPKEVESLAALARIKLSTEEAVALAQEFGGILGYVDQLKQVDAKMDAESRVGAVKNVTRSDEPHTTSAEDRERLLQAAPDREGDFIAVKKILAQ